LTRPAGLPSALNVESGEASTVDYLRAENYLPNDELWKNLAAENLKCVKIAKTRLNCLLIIQILVAFGSSCLNNLEDLNFLETHLFQL